eukprot:m.20162 g.20162  ORF g.20162 m.20162 type:complete len:530 (-) comp12046_c0_seq1:267-1856(-)
MSIPLSDVACNRDEHLDEWVPQGSHSQVDECMRRTCPLESFEDFIEHHLIPNRPALFPSDLSREWSIWSLVRGDSHSSDDGHPEQRIVDLDALCSRFGHDTEVPVSYCGIPRDIEAKLPCVMLLKEYTEYLIYCRRMHCVYEEREETTMDRDNQDNVFSISVRLPCTMNSDLPGTSDVLELNYSLGHRIYLKDWHLMEILEQKYLNGETLPETDSCPSRISGGAEAGSGTLCDAVEPDKYPYSTPDFFADDYLNEYSLARRKSDYRFVYLGPAGSHTLLHTDVLGSYSWSCSVAGRKRWTFFPPTQEQYLRHARTGKLLSDITDSALIAEGFPDFAKAHRVVVVQHAGETMFVPSGWYHQVENLDECLSVNANWVNAFNIDWMLRTVCDDLRLAQMEIADAKDAFPGDWHHQCQRMVRANCGFDFAAFRDLAEHVSFRICVQLDHQRSESVPASGTTHSCKQGNRSPIRSKKYRLFELRRLHAVLQRMMRVWEENIDEQFASKELLHTQRVVDRLQVALHAHAIDVTQP